MPNDVNKVDAFTVEMDEEMLNYLNVIDWKIISDVDRFTIGGMMATFNAKQVEHRLASVAASDVLTIFLTMMLMTSAMLYWYKQPTVQSTIVPLCFGFLYAFLCELRKYLALRNVNVERSIVMNKLNSIKNSCSPTE